ncbi:MAG: hypothetical protein V9E85_05550 [Candidatus Nanopelagicales bacterium]
MARTRALNGVHRPTALVLLIPATGANCSVGPQANVIKNAGTEGWYHQPDRCRTAQSTEPGYVLGGSEAGIPNGQP